MYIRLLFVLVVCLLNNKTFCQVVYPLKVKSEYSKQKKWVDSLYDKMSLDQRIGQVFMVAASSNINSQQTKKAINHIKKYNVGGVVFFKGNPEEQIKTLNHLQSKSKIPLLVGMDAEWGLAMRLKNTFSYPWNITLGAITDNKLIEEVGRQIGQHCKRIGVHINFAPVVDINLNSKNPIIGSRSFGEDKNNILAKSMAFTRGMQSEEVLAVAKHFPGHGNTDVDSHKMLPEIKLSKKEIYEMDIYPYNRLISNGISGVMVGHLLVSSLDSKNPASLSKKIMKGILKKEMKFKGLIFTDALNMKALSYYSQQNSPVVKAFIAGADVLVMPSDLNKSISEFKKACLKKKITPSRLEEAVKKILMTKYKLKLHKKYNPISTKNLQKDLITLQNKLLKENLIEKAITVVKNKNNILPLQNVAKKKIAYVAMGDDGEGNAFYKTLSLYANVQKIKYVRDINMMTLFLEKFDIIIIGYHKSSKTPWKSYKFSAQELKFIEKIGHLKTVILDVFTSPYALYNKQELLNNLYAVVMSYQNDKLFQEKSAQAIFGGIAVSGKLPISITSNLKIGTGEKYYSSKLSYGMGQAVKVDTENLTKKVDSMASYIINNLIAPGFQMLIARKGRVVFNKSYGYYTYKKKYEVTNNDLYDLASMTKILATLPEVLKMDEQGEFDIYKTVGDYLPQTRETNKADLKWINIFSHNSGLHPWLPFYKKTLVMDKYLSSEYYSKTKKKGYQLKVVDDRYIKDNFEDEILEDIINSELEITSSQKEKHKTQYKYSDLGFYMLKIIIEKKYQKRLNELIEEDYYNPIGAYRLTYNPLDKFGKIEIAPSEVDTYYRKAEIQGYVHDMGVAVLGGIGAHAGLFGNANAVAKMMQLYLNGGAYANKQFFKSNTFEKYNKRYFEYDGNRRGLILDKKPLKKQPLSSCQCSSEKSFGHTGFTGTIAWADPKYDLIYVFLSNRTYPTMKNNKLSDEDIRAKMQQIVYDSLTDIKK